MNMMSMVQHVLSAHQSLYRSFCPCRHPTRGSPDYTGSHRPLQPPNSRTACPPPRTVPPARHRHRYRHQINAYIRTYIHTPCCTFAAAVELVTVAGVGGYGPPGGASVFDWKACRWVPAEEVGLAKSKLSGFKAALVARLSGWLCFRLEENEKKRRGDTVIFTY